MQKARRCFAAIGTTIMSTDNSVERTGACLVGYGASRSQRRRGCSAKIKDEAWWKAKIKDEAWWKAKIKDEAWWKATIEHRLERSTLKN